MAENIPTFVDEPDFSLIPEGFIMSDVAVSSSPISDRRSEHWMDNFVADGDLKTILESYFKNKTTDNPKDISLISEIYKELKQELVLR